MCIRDSLYGEQERSIGVDDTYDYQKLNALEEQINQELVAQQMPFTTMLGGHGGYGIQWILEMCIRDRASTSRSHRSTFLSTLSLRRATIP